MQEAMERNPVILFGTRLSEVVSRVGWWGALHNPIVRELIRRIELELTEKP